MAVITKQELEDAALDAQTLEDVANGDSNTTVTSRLGTDIKSLAKAIGEISQFEDKGAWATSTAYVLKDLVQESGVVYVCLIAHTSGTFATDLAAGKWGIYQTTPQYKFLSNYASLSAAISGIGSDEITLVIDKNETLTGNVTSPSTLSIMPMNGYNVGGAFTWNINGPIVGAGRFQWLGTDLTLAGSWKAEMIFPEWWGVTGDGSTDDVTILNKVITSVNGKGGGVLYFNPSSIYKCTSDVIVLDDVTLDLNGSTINLEFTGDHRGIRLRNRTSIKNGTINLTGSGLTAIGADFHTPITIGEFGTTNVGYNTVIVENLSLSTNRAGGNGILVTADSNNIDIRNITIPDNANMAKAVVCHWGSDGGSPPALTTHPHNIKINNVSVGEVTGGSGDTGTIYLSGCYNVTVDNVRIDKSVNGIFCTAGDYGFTLASTEVQKAAHKGIALKNVTCLFSTNYGCYIDSLADNAVGSPIVSTPILLENFSSTGDGGAGMNDGIRCLKAKDVTIINPDITKHKVGIEFEESTERCRIFGGRVYVNREHGIYIGHPTNEAVDCIIENVEIWGNGTDAGAGNAAGVYVAGSQRTKIKGCILGRTTETQRWGIRTDGCTDCYIQNNHVIDTTAAGTGYSLSSSTAYGEVALFTGNSIDPATAGAYRSGIDRLPIERNVSVTTGVTNVTLTTSSGSAPASGTWNRGDKQLNELPSASSFIGYICVTGGTPGTWKTFGAISA